MKNSIEKTLSFWKYNLIITNKIEELDWIKDLRLKSNASIVSTLEQYGIEKIESSELIVFLNFFTRIMSNITLYGLMEDFSNYNLVSKVYNENKKLLKFTINFNNFFHYILETKIIIWKSFHCPYRVTVVILVKLLARFYFSIPCWFPVLLLILRIFIQSNIIFLCYFI